MIELYAAFFVIAVFYIAYFTKAALQTRQGVKTNAWHAAVVAIAIFLFHKQIKSEEAFMENAFGQDYLDYKKKVRRYL